MFLSLSKACNFVKKDTLAQVFPVNFAKFLRTTFLQNTSGRLLLTDHKAEFHFEFSIDNEANTEKLLQVKELQFY